jgi:hypothetical protein
MVLVELRAKECLLPIDEAQLLTHLKLSGGKLGLQHVVLARPLRGARTKILVARGA